MTGWNRGKAEKRKGKKAENGNEEKEINRYLS